MEEEAKDEEEGKKESEEEGEEESKKKKKEEEAKDGKEEKKEEEAKDGKEGKKEAEELGYAKEPCLKVTAKDAKEERNLWGCRGQGSFSSVALGGRYSVMQIICQNCMGDKASY